MFFRKITDGSYPHSEQAIRSQFANASLPPQLTAEVYESLGYQPVYTTPRPAHKRWERVFEVAPVLTDKGFYEQAFQVEPLTFATNVEGQTADDVRNTFVATWKAELQDAITAKRKQVEFGGLTLPNGVIVGTAKDDQDRISAAISNMERYSMPEIDFKADSGWVKLTLAELIEIGRVITQHVQTCFTTERQHHEAVDAIMIDHSAPAVAFGQLDAYDVSTGWPV